MFSLPSRVQFPKHLLTEAEAMNADQNHRLAELAKERVRLLERLSEIDREIASEMATNMPIPAALPTAERSGVVSAVGSEGECDVNRADLPTLLAKIAAKSKPLTVAEFVALSRHAGYASEARDYPNMVYQALLNLVRKGVLIKDTASRVYRFNGEAAES
jgi:hypothetical protein